MIVKLTELIAIMFDDLNRLAGWTLQTLPQYEPVLISDMEGADCSFLLHHFISAYLKADRRIVLVSLSQTFAHYAVAGSKASSVNLHRARQSGKLKFIDILSKSPDEYLFGKDGHILAKDLYSDVQRCVEEQGKELEGGVVVVDDLTNLLCVGCPREDVARLIQYLTALCKRHHCCLVTVIHRDIDDDDISLFDSCRLFFSYEITLQGLKSGHSKDVHGHLDFLRKVTSPHGRTMYEHAPLQHYRVTDRRLQLFAPGTSNAVL